MILSGQAAYKSHKGPSSGATQQDVTQPFNVIGAGTREYNMMMNGWLQGATSVPSLPASCIPNLGHGQH